MSVRQRMMPTFLDTEGMSVEEMEQWGRDLTAMQRSINWCLGDLARAARTKFGGDNLSQVFPADTSPGAVARWEAVANAYPRPEDRNEQATWTIHKNLANHPDRIRKVQEHVDAGRTSDEAREADKARWLLAIDCNYYLHRFWASGAGAEAATDVAGWIARTVERLREKGLTDVVCCFDGPANHRKELTADWPEKERYKSRRAQKDPELIRQLQMFPELLSKGHGFACVAIDGMEGDDVMASYAKQFDGKVTLLTHDKDARQLLSDKCNILADVEWIENGTSGQLMPKYRWVSAKSHLDDGCLYNGVEVCGISPQAWPEFQAIAGDPVDNIPGAKGIGAKFASDLIHRFGNAAAAIVAAHRGDSEITEKKRQSLFDLEHRLDVMLQLVTLECDLDIPKNTRI